ncbi:MAG: CDP-alcohol phosphatidyltransferase family protein [Desulfonatronovibrionaceae bacterium]
MNRAKKLCAISTHVYTSAGIIFSFMAAQALISQDIRLFLLSLFAAVIIDGTDGPLARKCAIQDVLPNFDGAKLDDLIDYLTYVFLPCMGLVQFQVLPSGLTWIAVIPMLAGLYGFCQKNAKTSESFVGFPSYWNVIFLYLYILDMPPAGTLSILLLFSALTFVPLQYIYPNKTRWMQRTTLLLSVVYAAVIAFICFFPHSDWVREAVFISLFYPIYYLMVSFIHHYHYRPS